VVRFFLRRVRYKDWGPRRSCKLDQAEKTVSCVSQYVGSGCEDRELGDPGMSVTKSGSNDCGSFLQGGSDVCAGQAKASWWFAMVQPARLFALLGECRGSHFCSGRQPTRSATPPPSGPKHLANHSPASCVPHGHMNETGHPRYCKCTTLMHLLSLCQLAKDSGNRRHANGTLS
jgi:hypothetical protein